MPHAGYRVSVRRAKAAAAAVTGRMYGSGSLVGAGGAGSLAQNFKTGALPLSMRYVTVLCGSAAAGSVQVCVSSSVGTSRSTAIAAAVTPVVTAALPVTTAGNTVIDLGSLTTLAANTEYALVFAYVSGNGAGAIAVNNQPHAYSGDLAAPTTQHLETVSSSADTWTSDLGTTYSIDATLTAT